MDDKLLEMIKDCIRKDDMHPFYVNGKWKKKRLEIMKRDHFECQKCKKRGKIKVVKANSKYRSQRAYVHHIIHLKDYPELALDDNNLITLCFQCHEEEHIDERHQFEKGGGFTNEERW